MHGDLARWGYGGGSSRAEHNAGTIGFDGSNPWLADTRHPYRTHGPVVDLSTLQDPYFNPAPIVHGDIALSETDVHSYVSRA